MSTPRIHLLRKSSPAMVLALLTLTVALSGTAAAAGMLATGTPIEDETIQTVDISERAQAQLSRTMSNGNSVEGSWVVTVTRLNPPPNVPPTFKSLMTFDNGGGFTETSNTGTTLRGPAHGSWERVDGRSYATTMLFFRFNPQTGAFLGTQKVSRTMRLSHDGQTFEAVSLGAQYDPDGVLTLSGLRATEAGERINVERIPDQP